MIYEKLVFGLREVILKNLTITEQTYLIAIWRLENTAYGVRIREKIIELTGKQMVFGTLYNNLDGLVKKGYVVTKKGESGRDRGGNIKIFYNLTEDGKTALQESRELLASLWSDIPEMAFR